MFPLCFVHGVHGVRHDADADGHHPDVVGLIAFRGRFVLAALTLAVVAALGLAGASGSDRDVQATVAETPVVDRDAAWGEFDITLLDEFP